MVKVVGLIIGIAALVSTNLVSASLASAGTTTAPTRCASLAGSYGFSPALPGFSVKTTVKTTVTDTGTISGCSGGSVVSGTWAGSYTYVGTCLTLLSGYPPLVGTRNIVWNDDETSTATVTIEPPVNNDQVEVVAITAGAFAGKEMTTHVHYYYAGPPPPPPGITLACDAEQGGTFPLADLTSQLANGSVVFSTSPVACSAIGKTGATIATCTQPATTGGKGTIVVVHQTIKGGVTRAIWKITWATKHGTTNANVVLTNKYYLSRQACGASSKAVFVSVTGVILKGGTGPAAAAIHTGQTISASICSTPTAGHSPTESLVTGATLIL